MKKSFIPLTALALFALVSCGNNTTDTTSNSNVEPTTSETSSEDAVNSVTITNKEALTAEWYVGNADRTMNITLDPAGNVNSLINKGTVKIVSSNTNVITVAGKVLTAAGAGKSTITVTYGSKSDSVEIEVKAERTAIDEYGTVHAGTEADPLDNEDAIKVAKATGETATTKYYYVKGTVASFRDAPSSYGNVSYYLTPATASGDKFLVYRATLTNGGKVTDDDIWVGAIVTAKVKIVNYNSSVPETSQGGEITNVEGTKPTIQTIEATVAEAVAAAKALASGATSVSNYAITGYVTKISGAYSADFGNMSFYMSDTLDDPDATFIAYQVACTSDVAATIVAGAKVKVTGKLTTYNGTPETTGKGAASVELVAAPVGASIEATIASKQVETGKTVQITTTAQDGVTFTYTSSDTTIATVDGTGLVTGVAEGNVTIEIAASTGRKTYIAVEVVAKIYPSTTIESFEAVSGSFGETGYTYTSAKANSSTNPGVYDGVIRLYQNGATFTIAGGETSSALLSIKITSDGTSTGEGPFTYVYGASSSTIGTAVTAGSWSGTHTQTISFDETAGVKYFQLTTTGTTKTARVYIKSLVLTFAA